MKLQFHEKCGQNITKTALKQQNFCKFAAAWHKNRLFVKNMFFLGSFEPWVIIKTSSKKQPRNNNTPSVKMRDFV